jgi:hypothetical protein
MEAEMENLKNLARKTISDIVQYKYWAEFFKGAYTTGALILLSIVVQAVIKDIFGEAALMEFSKVSVFFALGFFACLFYVLYTDKKLKAKWREKEELRAAIKAKEESLR